MPEVRQWELIQKGSPIILTAERIGNASSRRSDHNHPSDRPYAPRADEDDKSANRKTCSACYWTEVKIFRTHGEGHRSRFVVYTAGCTSIPGGQTFSRITYTDAHHEVLEILIERRNGQPPVMNATTARAMAQAASKDPDIEHAWINRALP